MLWKTFTLVERGGRWQLARYYVTSTALNGIGKEDYSRVERVRTQPGERIGALLRNRAGLIQSRWDRVATVLCS